MANVTALLTIALLLCSMLLCTARLDPAFFASITISSDDEPASITIASANKPCNMEKKTEGKLDDMDAEEENCGANDENCLLRRTLVAHTDYIYTQKKKQH